jgi:hypothetical protein
MSRSGFVIRDSGFARALLLVAAGAVGGCGGSNTPTTPTAPSSPTSETWSSVLAPGGASSKSFTLDKSGTITVTLTGAGATVGLGVGLPRTSGGGCRLGVAVNASPATTPQLSTPADAGQYCVQVFDLGTLKDPIPFALKIDHP